MNPSENRIKKLESEHRTLDTEIKRLYNKTYSEKTLKDLKQRKLQKLEPSFFQDWCN